MFDLFELIPIEFIIIFNLLSILTFLTIGK